MVPTVPMSFKGDAQTSTAQAIKTGSDQESRVFRIELSFRVWMFAVLDGIPTLAQIANVVVGIDSIHQMLAR